MYLSKLVRRQLSVFSVVAVVAGGTMAIGYLDLPKALFGIGHYQVTVNLPSSGGCTKTATSPTAGLKSAALRTFGSTAAESTRCCH